MTAGATKPVLWTADEAAAATGGRTAGGWRATGVSIDSRTVTSGDLFIAISGPNHDGHEFVADALDKGAAAAVVARDLPGQDSAPTLRVDDTMSALEDLARWARDHATARIAAITGSVGKTGTKEALRLALSAQPGGAGAVAATEGNLNNHWGLPLSLARLPRDAAFGVFEMGMNHAGEISPLSRMARPHVAVITTVTDTHRAFFDSLERIADAKAEIFDGLTENGTAILNAGDSTFPRLADAARRAGVSAIRTFGTAEGCDWRLLSVELGDTGSDVMVETGGRILTYGVGVPGRHLALNSLAVLAAVEALGADVDAAAASLADIRGLEGRGRRHHIDLAQGAFELIDESYNASPASMTAAIAVLANSRPREHGRRVAVLGDMLELGSDAEKLHAALVAPLAEGGIDRVFCAGASMAALWRALPADMRGHHAETAERLLPVVVEALRPGDVVMVKGSFGSRARLIVDALLDLDHTSGAPMPRAVNGG